jgi:DNA-binding transcriptional regulator YiaG
MSVETTQTAESVEEQSSDEMQGQPAIEPYKRPETLERLYWGEELSQYQIADRFGVSQQTIAYWMEKRGIDTRSPKALGSPSISKTRKDDGKVLYHIPDGEGERGRVYRHQLVALLAFSASEVFADDTHVHHQMGAPVAVDVAENLDVLGDREHIQLHAGGGGCTHPGRVLTELFCGSEEATLGDEQRGSGTPRSETDAD